MSCCAICSTLLLTWNFLHWYSRDESTRATMFHVYLFGLYNWSFTRIWIDYIYTRWLYHAGFLVWDHIVTHTMGTITSNHINYSKLFNLNSHCYISQTYIYVFHIKWCTYEFPSGFHYDRMYRKYWQCEVKAKRDAARNLTNGILLRYELFL